MTEEEAPPQKTSGPAIASLVLGLVGLVLGPLTGIPGLVLGIIAIREINASRGALGGKGLATVGVVTSAVGTLMISAGLFLSVLARGREQARRQQCMSNLKLIALALHMYAADNYEGFPNDGGGYSTTKAPGEQPEVSGAAVLGLLYCVKCRYVADPQLFSCPAAPPTAMWSTPVDDSMVSYGYDQRHTSVHPADVAVVSDEPPEDGGNSLNHFSDGQNVLFIDGHVEWSISTRVGHFDGTARDEVFEENEYPDPRWDSWIVP